MNKKSGFTRRTFLKYSGIAAGAAMVGGYIPRIAIGAVPDIKIGTVYPMSGPLAVTAGTMVAASHLAANEINARGGIKSLGGAKLSIVEGDDQSKPEIGMAEAERLISAGCIALTGCISSSVTLAATEVAQRHKTPFVVTIAVADNITQRGYEYVFRLQQNTTGVGRDYDEFIAWLGKKAGVPVSTTVNIHENTLFGTTMAQSLKKNLGTRSKIKIIKEIAYPHTTKNLTSEIIQIKALKPDIITPTSYNQDGILMTRTLYEQRVDLKGIWACTSVGHTGAQAIKNLGQLQEYVGALNSWLDRFHPRYKDLVREMESKYKYPWDLFASFGYDSVQVIADALERAGSVDKAKLRDAISKTNLRAAELCDPPTIKFGPDGQNIHAKFAMSQCLGQKDVVVWPERIKEKDVVYPMPGWKNRKI